MSTHAAAGCAKAPAASGPSDCPISIRCTCSPCCCRSWCCWPSATWEIGPELDKATPRFVIYDTNEVLGRTHPELFLHWMSNTELFVNSILQILLLQAWNPYYLTFKRAVGGRCRR
ncbi:acyltransferase [Pseudomonas aeruginosa]|nr:acyltransferase [Pseudomonas aeruginosa]